MPGWARVSGCAPDCAVTFFCFAKRKSPKKRRAGFVGPALRYGHAALLGSSGRRRNSPCGLKHLRLCFRLPLCYSPPHNGSESQLPLKYGSAESPPLLYPHDEWTAMLIEAIKQALQHTEGDNYRESQFTPFRAFAINITLEVLCNLEQRTCC